MSKKRNTHSAVCTFCRRRKVRCDKGEPCSACVKYGNVDCVYEVPGIKKELKMERDQERIRNEISILKHKISKLEEDLVAPPILDSSTDAVSLPTLNFVNNSHGGDHCELGFPFQELVGNNPVAQHDDKINFDHAESKRHRNKKWNLRRYTLPFTWPSLLRHDVIGASVFRYIVHLIHVKEVDFVDTKILGKRYDSVEDTFMKKDDELDGINDVLALDNPSLRTMYINAGASSSQHRGLPTHHPTSPGAPLEELSQRIVELLPSKKVIFKLVEIFFVRIYPLFPILDQLDVMADISRTLIFDENDEVIKFQPETKLDFATVGILFTLLRLSYLALEFEQYTPLESHQTLRIDDPDLAELAEKPISIEFTAVSRECFSLFDYFTTSSTKVLQCAMMNRLYIKLAPEEGDCDRGAEITSMNSLISSAVFSMGFHKNLEDVFKRADPTEINLSRKIWWVNYCLNFQHSSFQGGRIFCSPTDYDTLRPSFNESSLNIANLELERATIDLMNRELDSREQIDDTIAFMLNVRDGVDMFEVAQRVGNLETSIIKHYGHMHEIISDNSVFKTDLEILQACRMHLEVTAVVTATLYSFINYYEGKRNSKLVNYYVKKLVVVIAYDLIPFSDVLFSNGKNICKGMAGMFVIPELITLIQRSALFLLSFYVRRQVELREAKAKGDTNTEFNEIIESTSSLLEEIIKVLLDTLVDFSPRYFCAWRLSKVLYVSFEITQSDDYYSFDIPKVQAQFGSPTKDSKELNRILSATINRLRQLRTNMWNQDRQIAPNPLDYPGTISEVPLQNPEVDKIWEDLLAAKGENGGGIDTAYLNTGFTNDDGFFGNDPFGNAFPLDKFLLDLISRGN